MPSLWGGALSARRMVCFLVLSLWPILSAPAPARATSVDYVIEISVDGLGSSYLEGLICGNQLPNFRRLQLEGAWTLNARNDTSNTTTLPNHTTMLTGRAVAGADGHNYTDDGTPASGVTIHTNKGSYVASAFDVAHDNGLSTALFANKSKFSLYRDSYDASAGAPDLLPPDDGTGKIDMYTYQGTSATLIMPAYLDAMDASPLQFSFLHMRDPDTVGHVSGWGTPDYNDALKTVDAALGSVLDMVEANALLQGRTAIVVTADHGGRGTSHSSTTEPLNYTIPFFVWGPGVAANSDLYGLSAATRLDPGTGRPAYADPVQPIRNGDIANLGLSLLGLGPVPGSTINAVQDLAVAGSAAAREVIAYSAFIEAPTGVSNWTRDLGETELAFTTTSTPQGGSSSLAGTYNSTTSPLRYRVTSSLAEATVEPVTLRGYGQVEAAIDILVKNVTYHLGDFFSVTLTDGVDTLILAEAAVDASGDTLNALSKNVFLHYAAAIPAAWTTAALRISASNHLDSEDMDFDNIYFTGLPLPPATLLWTGAADSQWGPIQRANWSAAGEAQAYRDGDHVVLDDGAGAGPITLTGIVRPGSVLVESAADIVLGGTGAIAGAGGLTKTGAAALTLATHNTYAGDTRIEAGTLIVAADRALGAGTVRLGDTSGAESATLIVFGPYTVDRPITVDDDGGGSSLRTLGGTNTTGRAIFSGDITLEEDLTLTAAPGGEVRIEGLLDNSEGRVLTKIGEGTVIFDGPQTHGPGALLDILAGTVYLNTDAGSSAAADLSISVADAELYFGASQHLDALTLGDGGKVTLAGAQVVVLEHLVMDDTNLGSMTLTPEPATLVLLALGGLGTLVRRRRR